MANMFDLCLHSVFEQDLKVALRL